MSRPRKKTGVNVHSWNNIGPQIAALNTKLTNLREAATLALESDGGVRYDHEEDEVGVRACCYEVSYKPHAADCWVPKLRLAIEQAGEK